MKLSIRRKMEGMNWVDELRNEVMLRIEEKRTTLGTIGKR